MSFLLNLFQRFPTSIAVLFNRMDDSSDIFVQILHLDTKANNVFVSIVESNLGFTFIKFWRYLIAKKVPNQFFFTMVYHNPMTLFVGG